MSNNLIVVLAIIFSLASIAISTWSMYKITNTSAPELYTEAYGPTGVIGVSKMPMSRYDECVSANVSIDGIELDWAIVSYASVQRRHVFVDGDVGQFIELGKKTQSIAVGQGFMLLGDVVITNVVEKLDDETVKGCENAYSAMSKSRITIAEATGGVPDSLRLRARGDL